MEPSREFLIMASGFGQGFFETDDLVEYEIDASLTVIEHKDVEKLKRFLDDALSGVIANDELHQMWLNSPASIYFTSSEGTVNFLKLIRERLDKHPNFQNLERQE